MTEPRRLLVDPEASPFERELLGSWSSEAPAPAARERAMELAAIVAGGAAVGALGAAGGSVAPKAAATGLGALAKLLILGVVAASALTAAGVVYVVRDGETTAPSTAIATTPSTATATATATTPSTATAIATTPSTATAIATATAIDSLPSAPSAAVARSRETLGEQIDAMDAIRGAIAAGDGARALRLVDDYERRFPRGAFVEEAEALRVEAIARTGDRVATNRAAERFLALHPASPHAARVRALLRSATP